MEQKQIMQKFRCGTFCCGRCVVQNQCRARQLFLLKLLDYELGAPRACRPVDFAGIIAGAIFPASVKIHAAAFRGDRFKTFAVCCGTVGQTERAQFGAGGVADDLRASRQDA